MGKRKNVKASASIVKASSETQPLLSSNDTNTNTSLILTSPVDQARYKSDLEQGYHHKDSAHPHSYGNIHDKPLLDSSTMSIENVNTSDKEPVPDIKYEFLQLLQLVYPVMATYVLEYIPGLASVVLVGHLNLPDTKRFVDAATLSTMVTNVTCLSVGLGLASALDTLCSQAYGAKKYKKMGIYLQSSILVLGISLVPMFLINWYTESILLACGQDKEVSHLAGQFSRITIWGMPFLYMYELHRKILQSQSIMRPLVIIAIIGNTVNVLGGYILAYHTSMGFLGAAMSRTLGYASMMLLLIPYYYYERVYKLWWSGWDWIEAKRHVRLFLRLGVPGMFMLVLEWSAFEIMALLAGVLKHGVIEVSAHAVLTNVASLVYMTYLGIAVSGNIRVGVALGANEPRKARLICWLSFGTVFALGLVMSTMVFFLRHQIPTIIVNDRDSIHRAAVTLLALVPFEIIDCMNCVAQGIFRGIGHQNIAAKVNAIAYYIIGIPLGALMAFQFHWGLEGLWIGFATGIFTSLSTALYILSRSNWKQLALEAQERTDM